jgi:hypothetical protein
VLTNHGTILVIASLLTACTPAAAQAPVYGTAQAKDRDRLMVGNKEVRLFLYADFVPASTSTMC